VKPDIPNLNIQEKLPVKAYLLIPDASADISAIKLLPTRCIAIQSISVALGTAHKFIRIMFAMLTNETQFNDNMN
jgi:hypothetical protein